MVARLPRRTDLVFAVVESVKDYAAHARDMLGAGVQVRRAAKERHVLTVSLGS